MQPHRIEEPALENLLDRLRPIFPSSNPPEQKVALQLYRLLCKGHPVTRQKLAESLQTPIETIHEMLNRWRGIHFDDQNRIIAYWGLTIQPTHYYFEVDGQGLYTWCAWDTLFLPEILQTPARVESLCQTSGVQIRLTLSPDRLEYVQPNNAVISFMTPEAARTKENVMVNFCHFVHFFESEKAGLVWTDQHPGTFLLTIDQAHRLGQGINAARFPDK